MSDNKENLSLEEQLEKEKENKGKVQKAFEGNYQKLKAILGKEPSKKGGRKVPATGLDAIIADLFKDEDEALHQNFKKELKELLEKYVAMYGEIEKKKKELEKLEEEKMKEFNQAASKLFEKIDDLPAKMKMYSEALGKATAAASVTPPKE